jgi:DNA-binding CsgD family transcriptional regulator
VGWVVRDFTQQAGLRHAAYRLGSVPGKPHLDPVQFMTYSDDWSRRYYSRRYFAIDPVVAVPMHGILPTDWASFTKRSPAVKTLFGEAREHGVGRQGVTIPIRGCVGEVALTCFTSDEADEEWRKLKPSRLPLLHTASFLIHERVMEVVGARDRTRAPALSPRELDCLKYCAAGLRDMEIAKVLNISKKVVNAYLDSVRHKLSASTRPNAIARAIRLGLITADVDVS